MMKALNVRLIEELLVLRRRVDADVCKAGDLRGLACAIPWWVLNGVLVKYVEH